MSEPVHLFDVFLRDEWTLTFIRLIEELLKVILVEHFLVHGEDVVSYLLSQQGAVLVSSLVSRAGYVQHSSASVVSPSEFCFRENLFLLLNGFDHVAAEEKVIGIDPEIGASAGVCGDKCQGCGAKNSGS
jgi:hypothetical protein